MIMTTKAPDEVRAAFNEFAEYLDVLASDQLASRRWQSTKRDQIACDIKAEAYSILADDIRDMEFRNENA